MSEFLPLENPEITSQQCTEFIEGIKKFEPYFMPDASNTDHEIGMTAEFEIDGLEVEISKVTSTKNTKSMHQQDNTYWVVTVQETTPEDENGITLRKTNCYSVYQGSADEIDPSCLEETSYKGKNDDSFRPFVDKESELFGALIRGGYTGYEDEDYIRDLDEQELHRILGLKRESDKERIFQRQFGEDPSVFTVRKFKEVMSLLDRIDPEKCKV